MDDLERAFLVFPTLRQRLYGSLKASMLRHMRLLNIDNPTWCDTACAGCASSAVLSFLSSHSSHSSSIIINHHQSLQLRKRMEALLERAVAQQEAELKAEQEADAARAKQREQSRHSGRKTRIRLHRTPADDHEQGAGNGAGGTARLPRMLSDPVRPIAQGLAKLGSGLMMTSVGPVDASETDAGEAGLDDDDGGTCGSNVCSLTDDAMHAVWCPPYEARVCSSRRRVVVQQHGGVALFDGRACSGDHRKRSGGPAGGWGWGGPDRDGEGSRSRGPGSCRSECRGGRVAICQQRGC